VSNPLYWLELRVRAREKRLWIIALFFVVALLSISGVVTASVFGVGYNTSVEPGDVGEGLLWAALFCQAGLLIVLAPLATAGRISQEREQRTLPALVNSPASPWGMALGKLFGAWTFVVWLGLLVLPFVFVGSLWGGPSLKVVLAGIVFNLLAGLTLSAVSLGLSGLFGRSLTAYMVTGAFLFAWVGVVPLLGSLAMALNQFGDGMYRRIVAFATLYHNPFYPLIALSSVDWQVDSQNGMLQIGWALGVWLLLTAVFMMIAVRGLKREVY
jgi:ABC-type transport system involved in multi-copper enzyme maturation permease subunit